MTSGVHALEVLAVIDAETASIEQLVGILVERTYRNSPQNGATQPNALAEEVVLDLLVNGARYLLIRLPHPILESTRLSPREREIVRLVALGHSNKIIGDVLNISSWTVCTHLRRIFAKVGVGSRAAMVARLLGTAGGHAHGPGRKPSRVEDARLDRIASAVNNGRPAKTSISPLGARHP